MKAILANISLPFYVRKARPRAQPGQSCRPSGQPGGQASWPAKKSWPGSQKKALPERGNLKRELRSFRGPREKGSKQELPRTWAWLLPILYDPRPPHSIKGQSNEMFIQFSVLGSFDLKSQPHFLNLIFLESTLFILLYFLFLLF